MPDIKDSVGEGGSNQVHDVALLQAMLRVVKDAKNAPYLGVDYDGSYGAQTRAALERFQNDHKLVAAKAAPGQPQAGGAKEALGLAAAGGATVAKLSAMLPASHQNMRSANNSKTVYIEAKAQDAATSKAAIANDAEYEPTFRAKLASLVQQMYDTHKIALWITPTGRRRTLPSRRQRPRPRPAPARATTTSAGRPTSASSASSGSGRRQHRHRCRLAQPAAYRQSGRCRALVG